MGETQFAQDAVETRLLDLNCNEAIKHLYLAITTGHIIVTKDGAELAEEVKMYSRRWGYRDNCCIRLF